METISQQLLYQRLRNRLAETFEVLSSFEHLARYGAFATINLIDDIFPVCPHAAPGVFSKEEHDIIARFLKAFEIAAEATKKDTWSIEWFRGSEDWLRLNEIANQALVIFAKRGRFSEEFEEKFQTTKD